MKENFKTLARYNRWANELLYNNCGKLSEEEYFKDRKAFFKSIHGTLNHLLIGDRIWLGRFTNIRPAGISALDQILYSDFESLKTARKAEDEKIIEFVDQLDPLKISENLHYKNLSGKDQIFQLMLLLTHLFNHQTHHRGQVHNMLSQANASPPQLDFYYFLMQ